MRAPGVRLLAIFQASIGLVLRAGADACVTPLGIEPGGGDGLLDLLVLSSDESLGASLAPINIDVNPVLPTVAACSDELESSIIMRLLTGIDAAAFSMASAFQPNGVALDVFGDKATSDARRRCQPEDGDEADRELLDMHFKVAILYTLAYAGWKHMPWCSAEIEPLMEALGCPMSMVDVVEGDPEPSTDTPWGLAKAYVDESFAFLNENDGWNADGGLGGKEFNRVPFTGAFSYTDSEGNTWDGYTPKNSPYEFEDTKRWQPLLESNGLGYITTQEHVTPHIGITARFFGFSTAEEEEAWGSRELNKPSYRERYDEVATEVLEQSKVLEGDVQKQFAISFFDNKFTSLVPLKVAYFLERSDTLSLLDFIMITTKMQLALYNSTLLAWKEKLRHDAPRPPSIIRKELGDTVVEAFSGPEGSIQSMKASEWEPYIRTMPHSEYPSGSACLCEAFANSLQFWSGTDTIDPPLQFPPPSLGGPLVEFSSWSEVSQLCGETRLWAGLHFEGAVEAGVELCGGEDLHASIAASLDALIAGDESAAVFDRGIGDLTLRPL